MQVLPAGRDEYDLLDCMLRIDREERLDPRADGLCGRLVAAGLVDDDEGRFSLTSGGIERTQSLQHWIAADRAAEVVLAARAASA